MKKIIIAIVCSVALFVLGLIADSPLIATLFVIPLMWLAYTFIKKPQKKQEQSVPVIVKPRKQLHHTFISGVSYYQADELISDIDFESEEITDDWNMTRKELIEDDNHDRIWKYEQISLDARIETEPTNEHDPNALKVIATYDDKEYMLGYVPKEKQSDVKEAERYFVTVNGGEFKQLNDDDELIKDSSDYSFNLEWIK